MLQVGATGIKEEEEECCAVERKFQTFVVL
jgi:hypothetical protein